MDFLQSLSGLGVPGWLVAIGAILWIFRTVGLLGPVVKFVEDRLDFYEGQQEARTAAEQSEQVALWAQTTQLQSQTLNQNELLLDYIINDIKDNLEKILEEIRQQKYTSKQVENKLSLMVQIISELYDRRKKET